MQSLEEIRKEVENLVDKAGQKIDKGIITLIVGLRAHGIPTRFSCFGHENEKWSYPYVDIYSDDSDISFEDFSEDMIEKKSKWIKQNTVILNQLIILLAEFYSGRNGEYKDMIVPHCSVDLVQIRLKSIRADTMKNMSEPEFRNALKLLQKEISEFANFLIKKI